MQKKVKKIGIVIACFIILFSINTISKYASAFLNNQLAFSLKKTKFKIQFNSNGGIGNMSDIENIKYSVSQTLPSNTFTKSGYDFIGWNTAADGSGTYYSDGAEISFATTTNNDTIILYAQWFNKDYLDNAIEIYNYSCEEEVKTFVAPATGDYVLEAWGAQGGSVSSQSSLPALEGGRGGYSYGVIHLNVGDEIYVAVGCEGKELKNASSGTTISGGYNGGGDALSDTKSNIQGSGGGATHFAINQNLGVLENYENASNDVLIVAGGGGGSYSSSDINYYSSGGYAGGILGGPSDVYYVKSKRKNALLNNSFIYYYGLKILGADQTSHTNGMYYYGTFGHGADAVKNLTGTDGGAGGGWYGGNKLSRSSGAGGMAGSGGSGHVNTLILTEGNTIAGNVNIPTHDGTSYMVGNTGDGYARISIVNNVSFDGDLVNLGVENYQISPGFVQAITDYYVEVEETSINIIAESSDLSSTITGNGIVSVPWGISVKPVTITNSNNESKDYRITVNNVRPTPPIIQIDNNDYSNTNHIVSIQTAGTALSGVDHYEYYISSGSTTPSENVVATGTTSGELAVTNAGSNYIFYRTVSTKGNKSVWSNGVQSNIDINSPSLNLTIIDTYTNDVPTVTINAELTDSESGPDYSTIYYKLSTDSIYQTLVNSSFVAIPGATYNFYAIGYDNAGNKTITNVEDIVIKTLGNSPDCGYTYSDYSSQTTNDLAQCTEVAQTVDGLSYTTCTLGNWSTTATTTPTNSCTEVAQTANGTSYRTCTQYPWSNPTTTTQVYNCTPVAKTDTGLSYTTCTLDSNWTTYKTEDKQTSCSAHTYTQDKVECSKSSYLREGNVYVTTCTPSTVVVCNSGYRQYICTNGSKCYTKNTTSCCSGGSYNSYSAGWYQRNTYYWKKVTKVKYYTKKEYSRNYAYNQNVYPRLYNKTVYTRTATENSCWH